MPTPYVTVAIPYVNASPHLGYAYELVQADIYARACRRAGDDVRFLGGTDDYSLKNVLAAEAVGAPTQTFVDEHAAEFASLREPLAVSFDDFIRTSSDPRHIPAVNRLWRAAADDLYQQHYDGDYCVGCEQFYGNDEQVDGRCADHGTELERVSERNWFFRLSRYAAALEELIADDTIAVRPEVFRREVLSFIRSGLTDISVSRSAERARGWGVPVPGDPDQVVYVWFDALTNYISALDYGDEHRASYEQWWERSDERVHVIGKGILRFHAVYWPAFLLSAGLPLPTRIQVHPYLTVDGQKIAKSAGVNAHPDDVAASFGTDALRWFFARDVAETVDTDFTEARLVERANADLANLLGNTTARLVALVHKYLDGIAPRGAEVPTLCAEVDARIRDFRLRDATGVIVEAATRLNRAIEASAPWKLRGDDLRTALAAQLAAARQLARAAEPIVPELANDLIARLGSPLCALPVVTAPPFERITTA